MNPRQRPTLPRTYARSTIGGSRLNFRVRNGNGCDPAPVTTGKRNRLAEAIEGDGGRMSKCGGGTYARRHVARPSRYTRAVPDNRVPRRSARGAGLGAATTECPANGSLFVTTHACSREGFRSRRANPPGDRRRINGQAARLISIGKLHASQRVHTRPIYLVIFQEPSGILRSGRSHLVEGFTLRCFQRFSLPHIATERCRWHDNSYTRGASNPVLSY